MPAPGMRGTPALSRAWAKADALRAAVTDTLPRHPFTENRVLCGRGVSAPTSPGSKPIPASMAVEMEHPGSETSRYYQGRWSTRASLTPGPLLLFHCGQWHFPLIRFPAKDERSFVTFPPKRVRVPPLGDFLALKSTSVLEGKVASALQWPPAHHVPMWGSSAQGSVWGGARVRVGRAARCC